MKPKTEEFLNLMLWSADQLSQPTFRNLTESYESWAYRNGFFRQVARLEKRGLVESATHSVDQRIYRLSQSGRLHALGGRDPETEWARAWDGRWRLILFDLPRGQHAQRERWWRFLRGRCYGFLQNSVWITPDPLREECKLFSGAKVDVESLILLEARPCGGESDEEIVQGAWDFPRINRLYAQHQNIMEQRPRVLPRDAASRRALLRWAAAERRAWLCAVSWDPLLPERLLPKNYLGRTVWRQRKEVLGQAARQVQSFVP